MPEALGRTGIARSARASFVITAHFPGFSAWLLAFVLFGFLGLARADGVTHLILGDAGAAFEEAADAFVSGWRARAPVRRWRLEELTPAGLAELSRDSGDLLVPIGIRASRYVAEHHAGRAPVLALMTPRASAERLPWPTRAGPRWVAHVHIDQPPERSLDLLRAVFPEAKRIGLIVSAENAGVLRALSAEAGRRKLRLVSETIDAADKLAPALRRVLGDSDVLLLVPDSLAINAGNAQNVLLTTYRFRVPVIGFSQGLAKAGAVAAVYSSPAQIGRHGALLARQWMETGETPATQHAGDFSIAFNRHVARSLGVNLGDEDLIRRNLGARLE